MLFIMSFLFPYFSFVCVGAQYPAGVVEGKKRPIIAPFAVQSAAARPGR
jgi:hypothetical protein